MAQTLLQRVMCETPLDEMGDRVEGRRTRLPNDRVVPSRHRPASVAGRGPPVSRASEGVRNMLLTRTPLMA
jgi:hypothetical protein